MKEKQKELWIKDAGVVDGEWTVTLEDGSRLAGVQRLSIDKSADSFGIVSLTILPFRPKKPHKLK